MGTKQVGSSVTNLLFLQLEKAGNFKEGPLTKKPFKRRHSASFITEKVKNTA